MKKLSALFLAFIFCMSFVSCTKDEDPIYIESALLGAWVFTTDSSCSVIKNFSGEYGGMQFESRKVYVIGSYSASFDPSVYEKVFFGNITGGGTGYVQVTVDGSLGQFDYYFNSDTCLTLTSGTGGYMRKLSSTVRSGTRNQSLLQSPSPSTNLKNQIISNMK